MPVSSIVCLCLCFVCRTGSRALLFCVGFQPIAYANWDRDTPRIACVLTPLSDKNLRLAAQIGVTGVFCN